MKLTREKLKEIVKEEVRSLKESNGIPVMDEKGRTQEEAPQEEENILPAIQRLLSPKSTQVALQKAAVITQRQSTPIKVDIGLWILKQIGIPHDEFANELMTRMKAAARE